MAERLPPASDAALHSNLTIKIPDALSSKLVGSVWSDQMCKVLKPEGCRVETLAVRTRAPATLDPSRPNLVRLDVSLPQIDAWIVLTLLGKTTAGDTLSVVMMIGLDSIDGLPRACQAEATDVFTKPIHGFLLLHCVCYSLCAS